MQIIHSYIINLTKSRTVLWCYLIWYLVMAGCSFVPTTRIWLTSLGISALIGSAFLLNANSGKSPVKADPWQIFRLYLIPFCVSSFSSLVKDRGFVLIFSPHWRETALASGLCGGFFAVVTLVKYISECRLRLSECGVNNATSQN